MLVPWLERYPAGRKGWQVRALAAAWGLWLYGVAPAHGGPAPMPTDSGTRVNGTAIPFQGDPRCTPPIRPLNPAPPTRAQSLPTGPGRAADLAFANAFEQATAADWQAALLSYRQALESSSCSCERSHARAGQRAAREAWFVQRTAGQTAHPTQMFWSRLQYLTRGLACVRVNGGSGG